jgi:hypothetical protein
MKKAFAVRPNTLRSLLVHLSGAGPLIAAFVALLCILVCSGCSKPLPAHVVKGPDGTPQPEAGYAFVNQAESLEVQWTPGVADPDHPHLSAARQEGSWEPDLGYSWVTTTAGDLRVAWAPGTRIADYPHISTAAEEGIWTADPGYAWVTRDSGDFRVRWAPGSKSAQRPHTYAAEKEGEWSTDPGYKWVSGAVNDMRVVWTPGLAHDNYPNVIASDNEGVWQPTSGYTWATDAAGDFRVVAVDNDSAIGRAVLKSLLAIAANSVADPQEDDSEGKKFGRAVAGEARDELIKSAIQDVESIK